MEEILARALDFGMWVHGEYLRKELVSESTDRADLVGNAHSIVKFLDWYGQRPNESPYLIHGYMFGIHETTLDFFWWTKYFKPVLTCDSLYRTKHIWLGVTNQKRSASQVLELTKKKRFEYLGTPMPGPGLDMIRQGWVPLTGPERVLKEQMNKLKVIMYLGLKKLPFDLVNRICQMVYQHTRLTV